MDNIICDYYKILFKNIITNNFIFLINNQNQINFCVVQELRTSSKRIPTVVNSDIHESVGKISHSLNDIVTPSDNDDFNEADNTLEQDNVDDLSDESETSLNDGKDEICNSIILFLN